MTVRDNEIIMNCVNAMQDIMALDSRYEDDNDKSKPAYISAYNRQSDVIKIKGSCNIEYWFREDAIISEGNIIWPGRCFDYDVSAFKNSENPYLDHMRAIFLCTTITIESFVKERPLTKEVIKDWINKQNEQWATHDFDYIHSLYNQIKKEDNSFYYVFGDARGWIQQEVINNVIAFFNQAIDDNNPELIIKYAKLLRSYKIKASSRQ